MNASCMKNVTFCTRKRQLIAVPHEKHFTTSGRRWPVPRQKFPTSSIIFYLSCGNLDFRHSLGHFYIHNFYICNSFFVLTNSRHKDRVNAFFFWSNVFLIGRHQIFVGINYMTDVVKQFAHGETIYLVI
jgi:hypothetical protein